MGDFGITFKQSDYVKLASGCLSGLACTHRPPSEAGTSETEMIFLLAIGGSGGKHASKSDNSGTCLAGFQSVNPTVHTIVFGVIFLLASASKGNGPCLTLLINM